MNIQFTEEINISGDEKEYFPERRSLDWPNDDFLRTKNAGIHALLYWMMSAGRKLLRSIGRDSSIPEQAAQKLTTYIPDPDGRKAPRSSFDTQRACRPQRCP